jgi:hypothetical protein
MTWRVTACSAAMVLGLSALPASAQAPFVAGTITDPAACTLHVWPAGPIDAVTQGDIWNHTVNQAFDPARGGIARPDVLSVDAQRAHLGEAGPAALLRLEGAAVIVHAAPPPRLAAAGGRAPLAPVETDCHIELVVSRLFYDRAPLTQRSLKSLVLIRQFHATGELAASYASWGETPLTRFPPKPGDDLAAAEAELVAAYIANLRQVAGFAAIPPDGKGRRKLPARTTATPS